MKTYVVKQKDITRKWYLIDANDKNLGRLASQAALMLKGKHKPIYTPSLDTGDHIIIINAEKVAFTGKKLEQKTYYRHTNYPGGIKSVTAKKLIQQRPEKVIRMAIRGMLPKNTIGRRMIKKLKVYAGTQHPHAAQKPSILEIADKKRQVN